MPPTKNYKAAQSTGRRWIAMNKQDDGTYQVLVMYGSNTNPLATMVMTPREFKRIGTTVAGLLKK